MPIWLRNFTFKKIAEHYKKEQEAHDKASNKGTTVMDSSGNIKAPEYAQNASQNRKKGKKVVY
tara:strand:- start:663 stop:851 length:189 start_codon:yes stop_codon:yes gene_type:complete